MKAGTTSLYKDLLANPRIFMPQDKEPHDLVHDGVLTPAGIDRYAQHFRGDRADQICGEASTGYSKRPTYERVPQRARQVLGSGLKVIYLVREPVSRIVSQHYHMYSNGKVDREIDLAIKTEPTFIDYSRYAMQLEPWLDAFGLDAIRVVKFENYIADRRRTIDELSRFLGVPTCSHLIQEGAMFNRSEGKPVLNGAWRRLVRNPIYRWLLRPLTTPAFRERVIHGVLPKAPPPPAPPSLQTVDWIIDQLLEDTSRLADDLNWPKPIWDFEAVRRKYAKMLAERDDANASTGD
jgi:hypothetical protein